MWNVSAEYKTEIRKKSIQYTWYGTITLLDSTVLSFGKQSIDQSKSKLTRQYVDGETLEIGNAFSKELVLGLRDSDELTVSDHHYEFYGATIELTFRLYGDTLHYTEQGTNKKYEDVPCGIFKVESAEFTYHTVLLTAYDSLYQAAKTNTPSKLSNGAAYSGLSGLCTTLGITLATTQNEIEAMPNGTTSWKLSAYKKGTAIKDIIEDICTCICANAIIDREGYMVIKPYTTTSVRTVADSDRYSSSYVDYIGKYGTLVLENKDGYEEVYTASSIGGWKNLTLSIGQNVLINAKSTSARGTIANNIINTLSTVPYAPLNISIPTDPSIDIGDTMTGSHENDEPYYFIDTKDEMPLFGQMKITSSGGNYELANRKKATKIEKDINDLQNQTVEISNNVALIQTQLSEISGMVNIGYILPVAVDTDNIADGQTHDVLTFEFVVDELDEEEVDEGLGEAISFHSELCFYIDTTAVANTSYGDGILSVTYNMDGVDVASSAYSYGDGWKILTLNGFFPSLQSGNHTFIVKLGMSGGAIANQPT